MAVPFVAPSPFGFCKKVMPVLMVVVPV